MLLGTFINNGVTAEHLLEALPQTTQTAVHLLWLVFGELPSNVETIKAVGLHQRVDGVHKASASRGVLQQFQILVGQLLGILAGLNVLIAAYTEQYAQVGVLALQARHCAVQSLAQIQVQLLIETDGLVGATLDARIAVDQIVTELQSRFQFIDDQFAKTLCEGRVNY